MGSALVRSVSVPALVLDDQSAADDNAESVGVALAQGGSTHLLGQGVLWMSASAVVRSRSALYVQPGLTLRPISSMVGNVLQNDCYTRAFTNITLSAAGLTVTVEHFGHGLSTDDSYWIDHNTLADIEQSKYKGVWPVHAIVDDDHFVVMIERRPNAAPTTGFQGKLADKDIRIQIDGLVDYYARGGRPTGGLDSHCIELIGIDGLDVDVRCKDPGTWYLMQGALRNWRTSVSAVGVTDASNNCEIVKTFGPAYHGGYEYISGMTRDDGCSFQTHQPDIFTGTRPTYGDIINCYMRKVDTKLISSLGTGCAVLYGSAHEYMDGITVYEVGGHSQGTAGALRISGTDRAGSGFGGMSTGNFGSIRALNVHAASDNGLSIRSCNIKHLDAHIVHNPITMTGRACLIDADAEIMSGRISIASNAAGWPSSTAYLCTAIGALDNVRVEWVLGQGASNARGFSMGAETAWAAATAYAFGTVRKPTTANGLRYEATTAGNSAGSEPTWPTTIGNTVVDGSVTWTCRMGSRQITLKGTQRNGGSAFVNVAAGIASQPHIVLEDFEGTATTAIAETASGNVSFSVRGGNLNVPSSGLIRVNSASGLTVNVRSTGTTKIATGVWSIVSAGGGAHSIRAYGWDIAVDPLTLPLAAVAGQFFTSTRPVAVNQGPSVSTAAAFVALGTGAIGANTVIQ